jgi:ABC-type phosphate transport system permease subunit
MVKLKYIMLIIAVVLIAFGIYINEYETVFIKAVRICLECIGIG